MSVDMIHHYTDINTLSLILKYRTIRFSRLDQVDDINEGESFKTLQLDKFFFVSCWTHDQKESIPKWNMYTSDMAGVRISLPKKLFNYKPLMVPSKYKAIQTGNIISPIPFERIFTDEYMILPNFIDEKHFERKVEYVDDFVERKNDSIKINIDPNGTVTTQITDPTGIAALKSPDWFFQKEFRFVLFIFPSIPLPANGPFSQKFTEKMPSFIATSLYNGKGPNIYYFDVDINPTILDQIQLTTGPLCTNGDYLIVESLLEKYAPNGSIVKSKFEGTIRRPKRNYNAT